MSNNIYDKEKVLRIIAEFFFQKNINEFLSLPFENVYSEIVNFAAKKYAKVKMPRFAQARKIIIAELSNWNLFQKGERLSTQTAYRLKSCYYDDEVIEETLQNAYNISLYADDPLICIIKLPPVEVLDMLAVGIGEEKDKSHIWGQINVLKKLCSRIKKRNPDLILAVVPEFNRMVYLNENGKISPKMKDLSPICDTLCMFVKNTPEGHELVRKMEHSPHSLTDNATDSCNG